MTKPVTLVAVLLAAPVAVLSGCASDQTSTSEPTPPTTAGTTAVGPETLTTELKTADGTPVANATIDFANGYATVTVETIAGGILTPGFHGLHIHSVGKCEPNSVSPTGGAPGDFKSAGGHLQVPGHTGHPASGDLTSLEVRSDGSAKLVTTSDSFTEADLKGAEGAALIIHAGSDNFGNIPERYTQNGVPGPDADTLATGDAGKRVACGVISPAGPGSTSMPAATPTTATAPAVPPGVTTTTAPAVPPGVTTTTGTAVPPGVTTTTGTQSPSTPTATTTP